MSADNGPDRATHYVEPFARDRQRRPINFQQWSHYRAQKDYVRVAKSRVGRSTVYTNWLGQPIGQTVGPPHIFETYVTREGFSPRLAASYLTEEEALAGHRAIVWRLWRLVFAAYGIAAGIGAGVAMLVIAIALLLAR